MRSTHFVCPASLPLVALSLSLPCPQEVATFAADDLAIVSGFPWTAGIKWKQGKTAVNYK